MALFDSATLPSGRPVPVVVLADVSGSMGEQGKIDGLNRSMEEMLHSFRLESTVNGELHVGVVTFGGSARLHLPISPVASINWLALEAAGSTPLGAALALVRQEIEDRERYPSSWYRPTLILTSDGLPTDDWEPELVALERSDRGTKAHRIAVAIGAEADREMLGRFTGDPTLVLEAEGASGIAEHFRQITMSVSRSVRSGHYGEEPKIARPSVDLDEIDQ